MSIRRNQFNRKSKSHSSPDSKVRASKSKRNDGDGNFSYSEPLACMLCLQDGLRQSHASLDGKEETPVLQQKSVRGKNKGFDIKNTKEMEKHLASTHDMNPKTAKIKDSKTGEEREPENKAMLTKALIGAGILATVSTLGFLGYKKYGDKLFDKTARQPKAKTDNLNQGAVQETREKTEELTKEEIQKILERRKELTGINLVSSTESEDLSTTAQVQ